MTGQPDLRQLTDEVMRELGIPRRTPEPSRPTTFMGAPDLGHGWREPAWDDTQIHTNKAFGEA